MASTMEITIPNIGDFDAVPIIEIHVQPGDMVEVEDALITLESNKATMDVPAPVGGKVLELKVAVGDVVAAGGLILLLETGDAGSATTSAQPVQQAEHTSASSSALPAGSATGNIRPDDVESTVAPQAMHMPSPAETVEAMDGIKPHASPSVRRFARELGVDIAQVSGSGPKGRITQQDVQDLVKGVMTGSIPRRASSQVEHGGGGLDLLPWPKVDFTKFGPVESKPRSRINKISGSNLARNWVMIPAVTYYEEADITDLEALRKQLNKENEQAGIKLTLLAFTIKAVVAALKKFPELNTSLDGDDLVYKHYWHIGFATDTPHGLMVPVLKDAEQKGVIDIAQETAALANKAREGKLNSAQLQGGTFTISSLGGLGGTAFSPIVNAPEVAILGINKSSIKPVWNGNEFVPRLMLPLSLTADHRVVDGALATRFNSYLAQLLGDFRRVLL